MIGRRAELQVVLDSLDSPAGTLVVLDGQAGIGKTTLVAAAIRAAEDRGLRVLECLGIESQSVTSYAGLHELLHPVLPAAGGLPHRQRDAIRTAIGVLDGPPPDPLLIGLAALGLLEEASAAGRLLLVADDAQWLDPSSLAVLDFLARRIGALPVTLLAAVRAGTLAAPLFAGSPATRLTLTALGDADAERLVRETAPQLDGLLRERVMAEAEGNPLALREYATAAHRLARENPAAVPERLPVSRRLEHAFLGDLDDLPAASRTLLLLAAAGDDSTSVPEILAAGAEAGAGPDDLEPLERGRLAGLRRDRLVFTHPLVRSAVYGAATASERARAHQRLAAVVSDPVRAAWHRASATLRLDETVAADLEAAAHQAARRGARREAVAALRRAAELTPGAEARVHRLALAAEAARQAGLADQAHILAGEAVPLAVRPADVTALAATEILLSLTYGTPTRPIEEFLDLSARLGAGRDDEDALANRIRLLNGAIGWVWSVGATPETAGRLAAAARAVPGPASWQRDLGLAMVDPAGQAAGLRPRLPEILDTALAQAFDGDAERDVGSSHWLLIYARAAESVQQLGAALAGWEALLRFHHRAGSTSDEAIALQGRAMIRLLAGDPGAALADSEQALRLADDSRLTRIAGQAAAISALGHALRGEPAEAARRITDSARYADHRPYALITSRARWAGGLLALDAGRPDDAWRELRHVAAHPVTALWAVADLAEAGARSGNTGAAREHVTAAEEQAAAFGSAHLDALVHRAAAVLAPEADAEERHLLSIGSARHAGNAFEVARGELVYGEWLRRRRRIVQAREPLGAALREFRRCGAAALAGRALRELRAAGVTVPAVRDGVRLTAQEAHIARLAASGLSNREIAGHLHLSPRTVAVHLYRAFPKLGVTSRAQLAGALEDRLS
ncbi:putative LuxR-family transcriptional regulator [Actinoplanes missouriensis 431]|uniref:Putative LuxR-family transcriptional regulator n=1 Tax=Actinoplanes missouriensis (strain ATCC 14538 / DSM 43046 / CBS 188.64 / JCM 3121 / NBRC 102363 / NCIMB 12654 / NRRL B-3342 / UNCC 431) TaxID=512565 RepID=I0H811_ACTM4|nr:LuxR family transcriptional regulator [Actinoplanes missouriensis]BAL89148.1 putative LuxR-family transcriptional regulator [Actinoplanes missouriensis 431]